MYSSDFRKLALRILKQLNSYRRAAAVCKIRTRGHIQIYRSLHESAKQRTRSGHAIEGYRCVASRIEHPVILSPLDHL
jgi:hypothetical protein